MAVTGKEPPGAMRNSVQEALKQFARMPEQRLHALQGTRVAALEPSEPHEVFNLGLADLKAGNLARAKAVSWRFLLRQDDKVVASAEAVTDGGGARFSQFNKGPFVNSTAAALESSRRLVDTDKSYEARVLHVPALYTMILWLHDEQGNEDVYVPLEPAPAGIEAGRSYSEDELFGILREKASSIPDMGPDDRRGG